MSYTKGKWDVWTSNSHIRISANGQDGSVCHATIAKDGLPVLSIRFDDANRIVHCVNLHDDLVGALQEMEAWHGIMTEPVLRNKVVKVLARDKGD